MRTSVRSVASHRCHHNSVAKRSTSTGVPPAAGTPLQDYETAHAARCQTLPDAAVLRVCARAACPHSNKRHA
eukprot:669801-Prymnesium_polylepis.1